MKAITKFLAGGVAIGALALAAPASAQFFPGMGYPGYGESRPIRDTATAIPVTAVTAMERAWRQSHRGAANVPRPSSSARRRLWWLRLWQRRWARARHQQRRDPQQRRLQGPWRRQRRRLRLCGAAVQFSCNTDPRGFVTSVHVDNGYYGRGDGNGYYGQGYYGQGYNNPYGVYGYQRY